MTEQESRIARGNKRPAPSELGLNWFEEDAEGPDDAAEADGRHKTGGDNKPPVKYFGAFRFSGQISIFQQNLR